MDSKPLVYYFGKLTPLSPRYAQWQALLSEFQPGMQFLYLPGKQNVLADGLSQHPEYMSAGQPILLSLAKEILRCLWMT